MFRSRGFVFVVILSVAQLARGDSAGNEARRHYQQGSTAYSLGDFVHAAEEYKAAYKAKPDPAFLYNIAQAYRLANDATNALFFYRSFLHNLPEASNRAEVEDRIAKLEAQLAARDEILTHPPAPPPSNEPAAPPVHLEQPAAVTTTAPAPSILTATAPAPSRHTPVYKKWWLWTTIGVVVAGGAAATVAVVLLSKPGAPSSHFGTVGVYQ